MQLPCAGQPPLILQHQGHSRTIVGVHRLGATASDRQRYSLLVLDPSLMRDALHEELQDGIHVRSRQWQVCAFWSPPAFKWEPAACRCQLLFLQ